MKRLMLTAALILTAALLAYGADPLSIQQMFQQSPKETDPQGATRVITVRGGVVRQMSYSSVSKQGKEGVSAWAMSADSLTLSPMPFDITIHTDREFSAVTGCYVRMVAVADQSVWIQGTVGTTAADRKSFQFLPAYGHYSDSAGPFNSWVCAIVGEPGADGAAGRVSVGTVTTGAPGTQAAVTNSGNDTNAVLNITIPEGRQGPQGVQGPQGAQGVAGGSTNWRGEWTAYTQYANNDAVSYAGSSYIALTDVEGIAPPDPLYWNILASKGATGANGYTPVKGVDYFDGANGANGANGYTPVKGVDYFDGAKGDKGDKGDTGAAGGTVAFKGTWSSVTNYVALDVVTYNGSSYVAKIPSLNVSPTVTASWQLMAQKGADGSQGPQGQQGPQGIQGEVGPNAVTSSTTTNYNGILKGNGSTVGTAVAGTDYLAPTGSGTGLSGIKTIAAFNSYSTAQGTRNAAQDSAIALKAPITSPTFTGVVTAPEYATSAADGTWRLNVRNTISPTFTPAEGDMYTDSAGKIWLYISGQWVDKTYVLPAATADTLGGVKVGSKLSMTNGVLDVMVSSLGPTGLVTAGLAGDQTVSSGFAYVATSTPWKATFDSYTSTKQTTVFANYSGTLCAANGSKLYWPNPITFTNNSSVCAKLRTGTRTTVQMQGGKTYATANQNLQKIVTAAGGGGHIVYDTFTETGSTLLQNHTGETGATWAKHTLNSIDLTIDPTGDAVYANNATAAVYYASGTPPTANYTVAADVVQSASPGNALTGVIGRADTSVNTWYTARYVEASAQWELLKFVNNTSTSLGTYAQALSANTTYVLALTMNGTAISLSVNGTTRVSVTDSAISAAGKAGIRMTQGSINSGPHISTFTVDGL